MAEKIDMTALNPQTRLEISFGKEYGARAARALPLETTLEDVIEIAREDCCLMSGIEVNSDEFGFAAATAAYEIRKERVSS